MNYCVEVTAKDGVRDTRAQTLATQIKQLGISGVDWVRVADRYYLHGEITVGEVEQVAVQLLHDPIVETAVTFPLTQDSCPADDDIHTIEVVLHPGVTDSAAESLLAGAAEIGITTIDAAARGNRYQLGGELDRTSLERIAATLLANEVIEDHYINRPAPPPHLTAQLATPPVERVPLAGLSGERLLEVSRERRLSLDKTEMLAIQRRFAQLERAPTDVELEMLAQTWSEHCVHKTFRAEIDYTGPAPGTTAPITTTRVDSILDAHIRAATEQLDRPWVRSAFVDDAGIVALDETTDLAFKVETHNHPSALEPFGGANTGVGGVVRDVIGVSARPIANTNILCFGLERTAFADLPPGVLHPRRIQDGVVAGIEDYGNKMGIPTVNGAVLYEPGYTANPLVFCGCLGVLPTGSHPTTPKAGDRIILLGGRTGRDGLRGATFSSMESDHTTSEVSGSAVQIGHPIHEKQVLEVIMAARDEGLYNAITDCGAGGLSSSVGEMAEELGAIVHLERVPLKYPGLAPWEIWLSEAQERMVIAVPPVHVSRVGEIAIELDVEMTVLGEFTGDGWLRIRYDGETVGELDCEFLHNGIPRQSLEAEWTPPPPTAPPAPPPDPTALLLDLLASPNIRSKEHIVRRYDHEVQGGTVVKPFTGPEQLGPMDAAVVSPLPVHRRGGVVPGAALAVGLNPAYGAIDPYLMAWAAVDEAVRNVVAVGADPTRVSILDNFSWGNPRLPDRLGALVRCTQGCFDAAIAYGTPFISGKDSLNNEYTGADGRKHTIPGTLVISALGIVPDVARTVSSDLKSTGNALYLVGITGDHLGGSALAATTGGGGGAAPAPVPDAIESYESLHRAMRQGLVEACHDVSEGGIAVATAEMALGGGRGIEIELRNVIAAGSLDDATAAFSESLGRLLVEVSPANQAAFEVELGSRPWARIGTVRPNDMVRLVGRNGSPFIDAPLAAIRRAWRGHVEEAL